METPLDVLSRAATLIHDQLKSANQDDGNQLRRCDWLQGVQAAGSAAAVAAAAAAAAAAASDAPPSYASSGVGVGRDAAPVRGATKKERRHHHHHHHPHHPHHPHHQAHHGHAHHGHAHHHGQRPYAGGRSNGRTVAAVARRPYAEQSSPEGDAALEFPSTLATLGRRPSTAGADDAPLDMSTGARRSPPPPYHRPPAAASILSLATKTDATAVDYSALALASRASVITCASSLRSSPAPSCASPCGSTGSATSTSATRSSPPPPPPPPPATTTTTTTTTPRHRREIISSGMCDPVIDEHFRRSLGERYTHLFASSPAGSPPSAASAGVGVAAGAADGGDAAANGRPSPPLHAPADSTVNVTGLSVDDHFAKALGETWLKLQHDSHKSDKEAAVTGVGAAASPGDAGDAGAATSSTARPKLILT